MQAGCGKGKGNWNNFQERKESKSLGNKVDGQQANQDNEEKVIREKAIS